MSELRFEVGEVAVFAVCRSSETVQDVGRHCTIVSRGFVAAMQVFELGGRQRASIFEFEYIAQFGENDWVLAMDYQLRKLNPPAEPASLTRREEIGETA